MIPIPSTLTQDYYIQQKNKGKTDAEIANQFYVSIVTFWRWKKALGITTSRKNAGRPRKINTDQIVKLHQQGLNNVEIAIALDISEGAVRKHLWHYSGLVKPIREIKITREIVQQAAENGIGLKTLHQRVYQSNWSVERAVNEPVDVKKRRKGKAV